MISQLRLAISCLTFTVAMTGYIVGQVDAGNEAANAHVSVSDVIDLATQTPVQPASSTLNRNVNAIEGTVHTYDLTGANVYTMWWVVFNDPQHCATIPCEPGDLGNPKVAGSVLWATGRIADGRGQATFNAHLTTSNPEGFVVFGPGLLDPKGAEIHLIIRCHNEIGANGASLQDQLTTLNAGCIGNCVDVQGAIHLP